MLMILCEQMTRRMMTIGECRIRCGVGQREECEEETSRGVGRIDAAQWTEFSFLCILLWFYCIAIHGVQESCVRLYGNLILIFSMALRYERSSEFLRGS
jgi:hypothetical protein